jgi:hypothetical protein
VKPLPVSAGLLRQAEQRRCRQAQRLACLGGEAAADDQRDAATGTHFVEQHVGLHLELGDHRAVLERLAVVRTQFDHIAVVHLRHIEFDRQRARVFHRVVEDRRDLEPRQTPPKRLFGMKGMSSPVNHSTLLVADLRDEPVPTTSPT